MKKKETNYKFEPARGIGFFLCYSPPPHQYENVLLW